MKTSILLLLVLLTVMPVTSRALEVYRTVLKDCATVTGLVIAAEDGQLDMLTVAGGHAHIPRDQISSVLVYNSVSNPMREILLDEALQVKLVGIHVQEQGPALFSGWAVRFVDDLVFFYGRDGKSYNLDIHKIVQIDASIDATATRIATETSKDIVFGYGRNFPECGFKAERVDDAVLQPMQILSDQIKIEKWYLNFQKGFERLYRFQQRTLFYAKPRLYQEQSRIGAYYFLGRQGSEEETPKELHSDLPAFFYWAGGKPYLYQHQSWVGAKPSDIAPAAEPVFAFASDVKAHLFHGSFIISLNNPGPGYPSIIKLAQENTSQGRQLLRQQTAVQTTFNYMAYTGVDYGRWSISGGFLYPVFGLQTGGADGMFREVLASKGSPSARYRYTGDNYQLRALYTYTNYRVQNPTIKEVAAYPSQWLRSSGGDNTVLFENIRAFSSRYLDEFDFTNHYIRLGADWDMTSEVRLGLDEIALLGSYRETLHDSQDPSAATYHDQVRFRHYITSAYVRHEFDKRIAISLYLNQFRRLQRSTYLDQHDSNDNDKISLVTIFEFIL